MTEEIRLTLRGGFTYGDLRMLSGTKDGKSSLTDLIAFFDKVVEGGADVIPFGREEEVFTAIMTQARALGNRGNLGAASGTISGPAAASNPPNTSS